MNFVGWIKPPASDVNTIEELGNTGWNWESYHKYTLRAEEYVFTLCFMTEFIHIETYRFTAADEDQLKLFPHTYNAEYRGTSGAIKTTVPGSAFHLIDKMVLESAQKNNIPLVSDPYGGDVRPPEMT